MAVTFRPLKDRILVKRDHSRGKVGNILIPIAYQKTNVHAEVVAVGPGRRDKRGERVAPDVGVGDRVLISEWAGVEVKIDGEDMLVMLAGDVMAVIQ